MQQSPRVKSDTGASSKWRLPTLPLLRSTIGVAGLNFSVRDGKRWNPGAIATWMGEDMTRKAKGQEAYAAKKGGKGKKADGQLVMLGCGIAACTPASYQRHNL